MNRKNKEIASSAIESAYKSTIGQLPIVGTVLNELAFDFSSRIKQERLNSFTERLKEYFENVNEDEINVENILTEDFHDMFEAILKKVSMTKSESKLERFKNIIIGQLNTPAEFESIERFIEITGRLTEKQMIILYSYYTNSKYRDDCDEKIQNLKLQHKSAELKYDELNNELQKTKESLGYQFTNSESQKIDAKVVELNGLIQKEMETKNNTSNLISKLKNDIENAFGGKKHDEMDLTKSEYDYLINDIASLFLLEKKFFSEKRLGPMSYFILTPFGKNYIEFVEAV